MIELQTLKETFIELIYLDFIFLKSSNEVKCLDSTLNELWTIELTNMVTSVKPLKKNISIFNNKETKIININSGLIEEINPYYFLIDDLYIQPSEPENIYSISRKEIKIQKEFRNIKLYNGEVLIQYNNHKIIANSIIETSNFWEFDIRLISELNNNKFNSLIFTNSQLYLYTYNSETNVSNKTLVLDISDGTVIRIIENFTGSIKESNGLLYTSHEKVLQILNPETYEVENIDLVPELNKHGFKRIDYEKWFVDDNKLYFAQNIGDVIAKVGVFDLLSREIIDKVDLKKENGTIGSLQKSGNKLFVHTQDNTLHVFELEAEVNT